MAYEIPDFTIGFLPADQDLSNLMYVPVTVAPATATQGYGAGGAAIIAASPATGIPVGVVQNNPVVGEAATVFQTGISKLRAVGTIAVGDLVAVGNNGGIKATAGKFAFAKALESATNGDVFSVLLANYGVQ